MAELRIHNFDSAVKREAKAEAALHKITLRAFFEAAGAEYINKLRKERETKNDWEISQHIV